MSKILERSSATPTSSSSPPEAKRHEKTVPNYLRASRGSCHDLCKYGHKNPSEEEARFSGGRRKILPAHLNNLTLHRSAILDRSKDVRNRSLSLAKSNISLGEAERVAPKIRSANKKGVASNDHLVLQSATSADHKKLNSDGSKKHSDGSKKRSMVAQKAPTNLRYSNEVPKFDQKATMPAKSAIFSSKLKFPENALPENSRTVYKVKQSSLNRPASSPTKVNMIKQVPVSSQTSSHQLLTKDKSTPKGNVISPPVTVTRVRSKPGRSPTRSSNATIDGKERLDMSRSSFSVEPNLTASVEVQVDDAQVTGYHVESTVAELSSDATECIEHSRPAPEEACNAISEDDEVGSTEKSEVLEGEALLESAVALELQQSLDDQEFNALIGESDPEHKLAEQNAVHGQASKDEDSQTNGAALCQLSEPLTAVENADIYGPILTESNPKIQDDGVNASVESLNAEGKEEMGIQEDFERSTELLAFDEKHAAEPKSCLDFASGNAAASDKADEVLEGRMNNCTSHYQSISETSSDVGFLEEPKSMLIEPSDSAVHELVSVSNENTTFGQDGLKSRIFISQSPEELSDDEFYEEYDFELSESDDSGTEDEEATINRDRDEPLKAGDQRPRRISALGLDDASITPYKLKFKRGKIVELPLDSGGPRRLKFRRKSANEVSNRESQPTRRIYKRNSTNNAVPTNPDEESPGVKLRHQDAQEKKDAQGLFNNVIEETASKLVESRKSKVKALVGAFETVISLQDGKPTSLTPEAGDSQDLVHDDEGNAPKEAE